MQVLYLASTVRKNEQVRYHYPFCMIPICTLRGAQQLADPPLPPPPLLQLQVLAPISHLLILQVLELQEQHQGHQECLCESVFLVDIVSFAGSVTIDSFGHLVGGVMQMNPWDLAIIMVVMEGQKVVENALSTQEG